MKKNGFTLAEVLITLTIIGVVAVLTLPALMSNTQEQQARTALKKLVNTLTMAAQMNSAMAGFDYSGIRVAGGIANVLNERTNVDLTKGTSPATGTATIVDTAVYLKDGTAIYFKNTDTMLDSYARVTQADGQQYGLHIILDTNGSKGPNLISTCTAGQKTEAWGGDNGGDCSNKANRFIKDQYLFRLRGNFVAPIGAASTWMLDDEQHTAGALDVDGGGAS